MSDVSCKSRVVCFGVLTAGVGRAEWQTVVYKQVSKNWNPGVVNISLLLVMTPQCFALSFEPVGSKGNLNRETQSPLFSLGVQRLGIWHPLYYACLAHGQGRFSRGGVAYKSVPSGNCQNGANRWRLLINREWFTCGRVFFCVILGACVKDFLL